MTATAARCKRSKGARTFRLIPKEAILFSSSHVNKLCLYIAKLLETWTVGYAGSQITIVHTCTQLSFLVFLTIKRRFFYLF